VERGSHGRFAVNHRFHGGTQLAGLAYGGRQEIQGALPSGTGFARLAAGFCEGGLIGASGRIRGLISTRGGIAITLEERSWKSED
jgi:hypothetical protein